MPSALSLVVPWSRKSCERFQKYMNGAISAVRKEYPQLNYTFSCQEFGALQLRRLDLSQLDLIEVHLWASDDILWSMLSGHVWAAFATSQRGIVAHQKQARWAVKHFRQYSERVLERNMTFWTQLAERWEIPLVTSEGWVSTFYDDTSTSGNPDDWTWLKDLTQMAVRKAVKKGWTGICTSNFCQPHFEGMWSDSEWHRKTTSIIRGD